MLLILSHFFFFPRSSQGTLEIEDLHEDGDDHEASPNESEEEKQEYSTDEDHTDSDS